jgi:hypothetical protein
MSHPHKLPPLVPSVLCRVPHLLDHQSAENRRQTGNSVGHRSYQAQSIIEARKRNQTGESRLRVSSKDAHVTQAEAFTGVLEAAEIMAERLRSGAAALPYASLAAA